MALDALYRHCGITQVQIGHVAEGSECVTAGLNRSETSDHVGSLPELMLVLKAMLKARDLTPFSQQGRVFIATAGS